MHSHQFTVQPNLEVLAPPDLALPDLYTLCHFCDVVSVDVMTTLEITKSSLRAAMDVGLTGEEIIAFLENGSYIPLPETVRNLVAECSSKHGEVAMGFAGGYIHVSDRALLEEIRSHRRVQECVKSVVGDSLIVLTPRTDLQRLAKELRKSGFMPRVDSESVQEVDDGAFHVRLAPEELLDLLGILKFLTQIEEDMGEAFAREKARPLLERLQPDPTSRINYSEYAETIARSLLRRYRTARKKQIDDAAGRYKSQLARLLTSGGSVIDQRPPFEGPNPAAQVEDVRRLIEYAIDNESRVEIAYRHLKNGPIRDTIEPESIRREKVYAFSNDRDGPAAFALKRIRKAKLLV
ncbi:MAG: hypothetical protein BWZ10_02046 [candidate division BRC1 bacterium ADurb.BinA364]|nr:MAG: hypothetical protein BWZ10_02046 [candidate division BRC1 bacterium ADurb.BinA364]